MRKAMYLILLIAFVAICYSYAEGNEEKFIYSDHGLTIYNILPDNESWGISLNEYQASYLGSHLITKVGNSDALVLENLLVESVPFDVYYVFSNNQLSKITYIYKKADSIEDTKKCTEKFSNAMEDIFGKPIVSTKGLKSWETSKYSVQVGTAKLANYTNSDQLMSCIVFKGKNEQDVGYGFGYVDKNGEIKIPCQFDYAWNFNSDRALVFSGSLDESGYPDIGKYGYIDLDGKVVIPFEYDDAFGFDYHGYAPVSRAGRYGIIDLDGNVVLDFIYDYIDTTWSTQEVFVAFTGALNNNKRPGTGDYYVIKANGDVLFQGKYDKLEVYDKYCIGKKNNKWALIDIYGSELTDFIYDEFEHHHNDYLVYTYNGKKGYMDANGKIIIDAKYDEASSIIDGYAIVCLEGNYYLIDKEENIIVQYDADYVWPYPVDKVTYAFRGDLTLWNTPYKGEYCLIKMDGSEICNFTAAEDVSIFSNGVLCVNDGSKKWDVIDLSGNILFSMMCDRLEPIDDGLYRAKRNNNYAIINNDGSLLTDYIWDDCGLLLRQGLIKVQRRAPGNNTALRLRTSK